MRSACIVALLLASCASDEAQPMEPQSCEIATTSAAVQAADRKIIGQAAAYPANLALRERETELAQSTSLRREIAWQTVAKVLAPVDLSQLLPALPADIPAQVPLWHTWYGRDDINRLFHRLYQGLDPESRRDRKRFEPSAVADALAWNTTAVEELPNWPAERWNEHIQAIQSAAQVAGIGGIDRVAYSSAATRHVLASYPEILQCRASGPPAPHIDDVEPGPLQVTRESLHLAPCEERVFGPFVVAEGDPLTATLTGTGQGSATEIPYDVTITGHRARPGTTEGDDGAAAACRAQGSEGCTAHGPGELYITVAAGALGLRDAALAVEYRPAQPLWSACMNGAFPADAAVIKTDWRRAQFGFQLPVYDTSAQGLSRRLADGNLADWGPGESTADPGPEDIYTMELANGNIFRLAGLHIMTKELDHWLWITLWWSPDPDSDFGADRPDDIEALEGPWRNYKMCVVTAFDEDDSDPHGGFSQSAPSLAEALAATRAGGAPSWCSNPYIETGAGNAATNCMGCHQHAGAALLVEDILGDPTAFPANGRTELRNNFPSDYLWAVDAGDRLASMLADIAEYYDSFE